MAGMQWARLQANLNIRLRRGAWYRIRQVGPLQAVLEVRGQPLQVPRAPAARGTTCRDEVQPLPRQLRHRLARVLRSRALVAQQLQTAAGQCTRRPFASAGSTLSSIWSSVTPVPVDDSVDPADAN